MSTLSVRFLEPLARHTAWRTGGPCDVFVVAHASEGVVEVLADCAAVDWPVTVLGTGSRTVVRDGGIRGVVLKLGAGFFGLERDGCRVRAGAALPVAALLRTLAEEGLAAAPELYAVAGTVGASVLHDPWDLCQVRVARPRGIRTLRGDRVGPRTRGVVVEATLRLEEVGVEEARERLLRALRAGRPGSCFVGDAPRAVLRRAELERVRLRQIAIARGAPELLINLGGGRASDLLLLQKSAIERVRRTRGVVLQPALRWVGRRDT